MAGWGGPRPNSGRKPGSKGKATERRAIAAAVLDRIDEAAFWLELLSAQRVMVIGSDGEYERITVPDYTVRMEAAKFLTVQRDGRAYQQLNPAHRLPPGSDDPKLATVLRNLLPQPGSAEVTVTEKQTRIRPIQALENKAIEAERETSQRAFLGAPENAITLTASATSHDDPSSRKAGVGHFGAESHTERNQDSDVPMERSECPDGTK